MPSSGRYGCRFRVLQLGADLAEDLRHLMAEHGQDRDRHDGDEREQQRVLDEGLALLTLAELGERVTNTDEGEIRPHRKRPNGIHHYLPPFGLRLSPRPQWQRHWRPRPRITNQRRHPSWRHSLRVIRPLSTRCFR